MYEDFDIREEELEFVAQPYLFEPREASTLIYSYVIFRVRGYASNDPIKVAAELWGLAFSDYTSASQSRCSRGSPSWAGLHNATFTQPLLSCNLSLGRSTIKFSCDHMEEY
ncbi:hypothetical protein DPX16_8970 [Anabarilius grahami]|uniref:Uncharacterized protein n=1 Tax=Anabarilius grahami TaxID=495550 RepID=A0A3N0XED7_ANAGA|nr:hypothetical protein DPX16_8970 [Anabarilius grahami]